MAVWVLALLPLGIGWVFSISAKIRFVLHEKEQVGFF